MPTIRWIGLYGGVYWETQAFGTRIPSIAWELTQRDREVSAEWTIATRPFIVPRGSISYNYSGVGLLVDPKAVVKRFRYDAYTYVKANFRWARNKPKRINNDVEGVFWKTVPKRNYDKKLEGGCLWEAICYPKYKAIVIDKYLQSDIKLDCVIKHAEMFSIPVLIYQALNKNSDGQATVRAFTLEKM